MPFIDKLEGEQLDGVISTVKETALATEIAVDYKPEVDADGGLVSPLDHAGVVEMHQKVTTIVRIRGADGLVHTTIEVDHQYPTREGWAERTPEEVAGKLKELLQSVEASAPDLTSVVAAKNAQIVQDIKVTK